MEHPCTTDKQGYINQSLVWVVVKNPVLCPSLPPSCTHRNRMVGADADLVTTGAGCPSSADLPHLVQC